MIPLDTLSLFFAASLALAVAPGPDNLFVITQAALNGRMAGLLVTLGLCTGLVVHTFAVALGVAVLFQTSAIALMALQMAGATYLLYLAIQAFQAEPVNIAEEPVAAPRYRDLYLRGVIMNITNPKVAIFFLAFLPQFTNPANGPIALQMIAFGAVFMFAASTVFATFSWASGFFGEWLQRSTRAQLIMQRTAGLVYVALAARLLMSQR